AFIPTVLTVLMIRFVREKRKAPVKIPKLDVGLKGLPFNLKMFIAAATVFTIGNFGYAFLLLKSQQLGNNAPTSILMYVLFYAVFTLFTIPVGAISDRLGRMPIIIIGYILFAFVSIGLIYSNTLPALIIMFIIYGIFFALIDGSHRAFVVDLCPKSLKGTALGTFHTFTGFAALPGGFAAGYLWDAFGSNATFVYGALASAVALILFLFVRRK
ncbi:MFS transporter, partial [Candidatus Woesearchaeota archaeon]|nr:MFS transporter [Candidatus Woesearchaeota archaeon]